MKILHPHYKANKRARSDEVATMSRLCLRKADHNAELPSLEVLIIGAPQPKERLRIPCGKAEKPAMIRCELVLCHLLPLGFCPDWQAYRHYYITLIRLPTRTFLKSHFKRTFYAISLRYLHQFA